MINSAIKEEKTIESDRKKSTACFMQKKEKISKDKGTQKTANDNEE